MDSTQRYAITDTARTQIKALLGISKKLIKWKILCLQYFSITRCYNILRLQYFTIIQNFEKKTD